MWIMFSWKRTNRIFPKYCHTREGLSHVTKCSTIGGLNGLKSLFPSIDYLSKGSNVAIFGGTLKNVEKDFDKKVQNDDPFSATRNEFRQNVREAETHDLFLQEIEPIQISGYPRLKINPVNMFEDEAIDSDLKCDIGAAVCLLSTKQFMDNVKLSPLGKVLSFVEASSDLSVASLLEMNKLSVSNINLWQINDRHELYNTVKELNIDETLVNIHSGSPVLGFGGVQDMIHLMYSLDSNQKGIVVHKDEETCLSVLIEKLPLAANFITSDRKPIVTLFTKEPCSLCDDLKLELTPYLDQIHLEQVYLTPESYWHKLYRYEIPVLFLGGRYVCRNKFNVRLFEKLLESTQKELE